MTNNFLTTFNTFSVYDNDTDKCILKDAEYCDIESYLDNKKYSIIWNLNGMDLNEECEGD